MSAALTTPRHSPLGAFLCAAALLKRWVRLLGVAPDARDAFVAALRQEISETAE